MDLWNRQEAASVDLARDLENQRCEAANQQECRIREDRRGTIVLTKASNLKEKETARPA